MVGVNDSKHGLLHSRGHYYSVNIEVHIIWLVFQVGMCTQTPALGGGGLHFQPPDIPTYFFFSTWYGGRLLIRIRNKYNKQTQKTTIK